MSKLCERPGCSGTGAAAYGMVPEELIFWLDHLHVITATQDEIDQRVLCQTHADAMTVPRGWTLDDRRDPDLHLFNTRRFTQPARRVPPTNQIAVAKTVVTADQATSPDAPPSTASLARPASRALPGSASAQLRLPAPEQLIIDGTGETPRPNLLTEPTEPAEPDEPDEPAEPVEPAEPNDVAVRPTASDDPANDDADERADAAPWRPQFDPLDDLNGLLNVDSPLLRRAFTGSDMNRTDTSGDAAARPALTQHPDE